MSASRSRLPIHSTRRRAETLEQDCPLEPCVRYPIAVTRFGDTQFALVGDFDDPVNGAPLTAANVTFPARQRLDPRLEFIGRHPTVLRRREARHVARSPHRGKGDFVPNSPADEKRINTIRFLAVDAVQKANSGHPGLPLGARRHGVHAVVAAPAVQPERSALVRPRPLRALGRPRVDAAVRAAVPHRLRPDARRPQDVPPARQQDAGPPRSRTHAGRRGDDRAARPGLRATRVGHGDRRSASRRRLQPRRSAIVDHYTY